MTIRASVWGEAPSSACAAPTARQKRAPIAGPAVHPLPEATLYVPAGWSGEMDEWGTIHLQRSPSS